MIALEGALVEAVPLFRMEGASKRYGGVRALEKASLKKLLDLSPREIAILAPLVILTIFYGVYPAPVLDVTAASVKNLVQNYEAAVKPAAAMLAP